MIDFDKHYPTDVFTPLSTLEKNIVLKALEDCKVKHATMRLFAEWARNLADIARHDESAQSDSAK